MPLCSMSVQQMKDTEQIREAGRGFVFICVATTAQRVNCRSPGWTVIHRILANFNCSNVGMG
jgi:hypothetical protein